jgi:hypothetical protein
VPHKQTTARCRDYQTAIREALRPLEEWDDWLAGLAALAIGDDGANRAHLCRALQRIAIVSKETNCLLNPDHPAFARLEFTKPMPFLLDPRLMR